MLPKSVLITGCSSGIGQAVALELAQNGYEVWAGVRKPSDFELIENLKITNLHPIYLDVTKSEDIQKAYQQLEKHLPDGLFCLINNAGINYIAPFELAKENRVRSLFDINVFGSMNVAQVFLPLLQRYHLKQGDHARIIQLASIASEIGMPWQFSYHTAKHALYGMSKSMRIELEPLGIWVSCLLPGAVQTQLFAKANDDIANIAHNADSINHKYYQINNDHMSNLSDSFYKYASKVSVVAKTVRRTLHSKHPRFKIIIGFDAQLLYYFNRLLPETVYLYLIRKLMVKTTPELLKIDKVKHTF